MTKTTADASGKKVGKCGLCLLLLALYLPLSSTFYSKIPTVNSNCHVGCTPVSQVGTPYSGFAAAKKNFEVCNVLALIGMPPLIVVSLPLTLLDIAGSLLLDTLFLPVDLLVEDRHEWKAPRMGQFRWK